MVAGGRADGSVRCLLWDVENQKKSEVKEGGKSRNFKRGRSGHGWQQFQMETKGRGAL